MKALTTKGTDSQFNNENYKILNTIENIFFEFF